MTDIQGVYIYQMIKERQLKLLLFSTTYKYHRVQDTEDQHCFVSRRIKQLGKYLAISTFTYISSLLSSQTNLFMLFS